jgi:hypothetical protein
MPVIVMVRHPAAVVASAKRLGWSFDIASWLDSQPELSSSLDDVLHPPPPYSTLVEEISVLWKCLYSTLRAYLSRNPDMMMVRHEDLCRSPIETFEKLYSYAGLCFDTAAVDQVRKHTQPSNTSLPADHRSVRRNSHALIKKWKTQLSDREIQIIHETTEDVASSFYDPGDW